MVRAHMKQTPEEKKETHKKKTPQKKKAPETGVWPCKINGCNKQFAREADLKRHQRTTKLHSMPGFRCPQCDATFTRTDALRRHQKSRHNGVVIEPDPEAKAQEGGDGGSPKSKSKSRSGSPTSKPQENAVASTSAGSSSSTQPKTPGPPPGPSSYYRPHTMQGNPHPFSDSVLANSYRIQAYPPPPGMIIDASHYQTPIGLPTSATRGSWPPGPPPGWAPDGHPPPMGAYPPIPPHPGFYHHPSPYYRHPVGAMPMHPGQPLYPHPMHPDAVPLNSPPNGLGATTNPPSTEATGPQGTNVDSTQSAPNSDAEMQDAADQAPPPSLSTAPVIDPSLEAQQNTPPNSEDKSNLLSLEMTQAAVQAVLESVRRESASPSAKVEDPGPAATQANERGASAQSADSGALVASQGPGEPDGDADADAEGDEEEASAPTQGTPSTSHPLPSRPAPMEHMLTEDGEPMLNPGSSFLWPLSFVHTEFLSIAELLTQESLESPPPS
ncbi:hypothetical protein JAAARDRAFT_358376 [Jaapia argillacea MUCL 33604]|uniref:C2H2-type domain-containing protein n=1 Tax=Jaapia argillacea MUCL 33604 TaxID=933084 RepID=A0A067Q751_9AGAM|nr:hypothetical protein JAAARDRAFT_358376 [Jaapia argillacea MUCL 33604]